ncbi:hypothetical protein L227DRAFT_504863 [Lentinus tigrinus ALCF2SS1-6]|uniref:PWWP domain-containing protein n=1 Tax=Lentinus tigrinus ALCF2SS1-6 TaxID=1328759 RepID=A0A5C2S6F5_9APHY|nr:hypothetical protein L227DRAFT_504863 [Lentinus tigrinus ALCF2SS1-6]
MSKKAAKIQTYEQSYEVRDVVLAKIRGFPPWPAMIVDPDSVPAAVARERPNAKTKKGNWYCVRFFPVGDYAWIVPKDISRLQQHEIEAYINEPYKKNGDLLKGYRIALNPAEWEAERDAAAAEAREDEANAEVDQLESDGEEEADEDVEKKKKPKPKKRKRESDAAPAKAKSKAKKSSTEPASKPRATPVKGKKNGPKSKAVVESEDEGAGNGGHESTSKRSSPPPTKKAKRSKEDDALANDPEANKVREWRHKLQKAFLNPNLVPKEEEIPALDQLFSTVENYPHMTMEYLLFSKIGKVMRHIYILPDDRVPRDDEFKFRERAKVLVDKWHDIAKTNGASDFAKPATNGTRKAADAEDTGVNGAETEEHSIKPESDVKPDVIVKNDGAANGAADESILADVTMSEAA